MENGTVALSVTELNEYARRLISGDPLLRNLQVEGEISGYKHHYSGHRYFSLKDASARVQCVMFRQNGMGLEFEPADGMRVVVRASASIFTRDGSYQLYVTSMRKAGQGDLYARFEALKQKLMKEGLFDPARKRPIPMLPRIIGVATSETGAAIRDIIHVARRRDPGVGIVIAPCAVQGEAAVEDIVRAIDRLNRQGECDVLLVGRGGGSIEDLWAFNEERVARAIAASKIPVISCVGHEIDFTIADFVADLRAPTPSAAAELAVPVRAELRGQLDRLASRVLGAMGNGQRMRRMRLQRVEGSMLFAQPRRMLIEPRRVPLQRAGERLSRAMPALMEMRRRQLHTLGASLRALNPEAVLDRGYAIVSTSRGMVERVQDVVVGETISVRMSQGVIDANVTAISSKE